MPEWSKPFVVQRRRLKGVVLSTTIVRCVGSNPTGSISFSFFLWCSPCVVFISLYCISAQVGRFGYVMQKRKTRSKREKSIGRMIQKMTPAFIISRVRSQWSQSICTDLDNFRWFIPDFCLPATLMMMMKSYTSRIFYYLLKK